ncbi:helix-turn-helix domain-containing protein [Natribacillus halophilus]|uniref:DNA-binding transcriptional regulator, XRE-family HTH domain n=1 Tax=Natribacillus halophilus TaxID=549003 RepID=A0A1G8R2Q6_9BACI|nr:helix-turn-helix domain-containing protein [Natribacillus halophilus]SDJ11221.1 DNA-binding transcriptional regulator, XRE-family HTH domain [Natribacillus halophilus]
MQYDTIGFNVRYYREMKGLTQKQLAEDICTQAQISKIEKGDIIPLSSTLYEIAKKLDIDVNYFFQIGEHERLDYIEELKDEIRKKIRDYDYKDAMETLQSHEKFFNTIYLQQFHLWHLGICVYHLYGNYNKAMEYINESLAITYRGSKIYTEREIEIMNSMAIIQYSEGNCKEAHENLLKAINASVFVPALKPHIKVRMWYNLSNILTMENRYKESLQAADRGIQICVREEMMYLLGELLFQKGFCERKLDVKLWKRHFEQAIGIFEVAKKEHLAEMAKKEMEHNKE